MLWSEALVNEYVEKFCDKHDVYVDFWIADKFGGICLIGDNFFDFIEDIKVDIDKNRHPDLIWEWYGKYIEAGGKKEYFPKYKYYKK